MLRLLLRLPAAAFSAVHFACELEILSSRSVVEPLDRDALC
jgi:hypothetical protein